MHPYATQTYGTSLAHWGEVVQVNAWQNCVIKRPITATHYDAAGTYPIMPFTKDTNIPAGIDELKQHGFVSLVMVLDDFHRPELDALHPYATTLSPFKTHYLYRRSLGELTYDTHHKRALKKAVKSVQVDIANLADHVEAWTDLYHQLTTKLQLKGLHAFPLAHHQILASLENVIFLGAWIEDALVAGHIFVRHNNILMSHLVASNAAGYEHRASFALNDFAIRHFTDIDIINFGGGAGNSVGTDDGLARFKRGFANDTANTYLCGIILDTERYETLSKAHTAHNSSYFPRYRG